jgi:hypothetical protein
MRKHRHSLRLQHAEAQTADSARGCCHGAGTKCTLAACLEQYVSEELMQGMDEAYCSKCKKHGPAKKRLSFARLPRVLVVHLKRFEPRRKLTTLVRVVGKSQSVLIMINPMHACVRACVRAGGRRQCRQQCIL